MVLKKGLKCPKKDLFMTNSNYPRKDNHIRDHLANERTFLAWIRTSLGLIAFGFVIERFILFSNQIQHWLSVNAPSAEIHPSSQAHGITTFGIFLIACGAFTSLFAFYKYTRLEKQIDEETYVPSYTLAGFLATLLFLCGILLIIYLTYR